MEIITRKLSRLKGENNAKDYGDHYQKAQWVLVRSFGTWKDSWDNT